MLDPRWQPDERPTALAEDHDTVRAGHELKLVYGQLRDATHATVLDNGGRIELSLTLDPTTTAPARAREAVRAAVVDLDQRRLGVLELLVSELVTNSVLHGTESAADVIRVVVTADDDTKHVSVTDYGPGFDPTDLLPTRDAGGLGLVVVDRAASRWGTRDGGRCVWFELTREPPPQLLPALEPARAEPMAVGAAYRMMVEPDRSPAIARLADRMRPFAIGVGAVVLSALGGLIVGEVMTSAGADHSRDARPAANAVPALSALNAADVRHIQARAFTYQAALSAASTKDPCASLSMGAGALLSTTGSCQTAIRKRDAALAGSTSTGVTNLRSASVVDSSHGYATVPGARATWRSDPTRSVSFVRERGRWVIAQ
jgi:anti-sigma regulatory factor (Ser/Thr protein kinase)